MSIFTEQDREWLSPDMLMGSRMKQAAQRAIEEIDSLRAQVAEVKGNLGVAETISDGRRNAFNSLAAENNALRSEVERLRGYGNTGAGLIAAERERQLAVEGWNTQHDDNHEFGELANAAMCYLEAAPYQHQHNVRLWPWDAKWWKPKDRIRNLVKAGALVAAEIDRLKRHAPDCEVGAALAGAPKRPCSVCGRPTGGCCTVRKPDPLEIRGKCAERFGTVPVSSDHVWMGGLHGEPVGACIKCGLDIDDYNRRMVDRWKQETGGAA